ncbi:TPA: hypothetical protein ACPY3K_003503 [Enterobacter hormaechei subsp. xiangfangensis]|uniref:hypothetical protein n=1 Tax=Enterobacter hormaechei TaxID=158836 RepID=UPI003523E5BB
MKLNYEELEAKCAALAAENAGIKAAIDETIRWQQSTEPENVESVRMLVDVKTPATDAFLAEVRAQGVEQLAALAGNECQRYKSVNGRAGWRKWKSIVILCTDFAAQLRKGVQS